MLINRPPPVSLASLRSAITHRSFRHWRIHFGYLSVILCFLHGEVTKTVFNAFNDADNATRLGVAVLENFEVFPERNWFWIDTGALLGFEVLFNILFTFALMSLNPFGKPQAITSKDVAKEMENNREQSKEEPRLRRPVSKKKSVSRALSSSDENNTREMEIHRLSS